MWSAQAAQAGSPLRTMRTMGLVGRGSQESQSPGPTKLGEGFPGYGRIPARSPHRGR